MNFPSSPTPGQTYTLSGRTWTWNGTAWDATLVGAGIPAAGTTGQVLTKASGDDYDAAWTDPADKIIEGNSSVEVIDAGAGEVAITLDGSVSVQHQPASTNFVSTAAYRIRADFDNAAFSNRTFFQTIGANANTSVGVIPSGSASQAQFIAVNGASATDVGFMVMGINASVAYLSSSRLGSGTSVPLELRTGDAAVPALTIATSGDITAVATLSAKCFRSAEYDHGNISGTSTVNLANGQNQKMTLTGTVTGLTLSNPVAGATYKLLIINGGAHTLAWTTTIKWAGGFAPVITPSGRDIVTLYYNGTDYYGMVGQAFS